MADDVRQTMLEVIENFSHGGSHHVQSVVVVEQTVTRLGKRHHEDVEREALRCWHDLMRTGFLAWGFNLSNPNPPFAHVTPLGRKALENVSRDPSNPRGYLAALQGVLASGSVAESYVVEALATFNAGCFKAAAVLVGGAGEAIVLELRNDLVARLTSLSRPVPNDLNDWRIKRVLDALEKECATRTKTMPKGLGERFDAFWSSFTGHLRLARNDVGHPKTIEPVTVDVVHGSLLIFPELVKLVGELRAWVASPAFQ